MKELDLPPIEGAHQTGDYFLGLDTGPWVCVRGGTPGTWVSVHAPIKDPSKRSQPTQEAPYVVWSPVLIVGLALIALGQVLSVVALFLR